MDSRLFKRHEVYMIMMMALLPAMCYSSCDYPAIFNFGDSTSDTGTIHYVFPYNMLAENPPYGRTFFGRPVNRYSDGRLSIDFFAQALGLPFLSPYVQSVASNFGHGANFAAAGATVRETNFIAPISLTVQINQYKVFKQQVLECIQAHGNVSYLPTMDAFKTGIYILEIGGNDFSFGYMNLHLNTSEVQRTILPKVARSIGGAVQALYNEGARTILVKDVGPQGCQPFWLTFFHHSSTDFDQYGCSVSYNNAVRLYNRMLRAQLVVMRKELPDATIIYVNTYDIVYDFFVNPSKYGFKFTTRACCGIGGKYNYDYAIQCGTRGTLNGSSVTAESCSDPASYVNWDGVHWTDKGNKIITQQILSAKFFDPAFSIAAHCDLQPL